MSIYRTEKSRYWQYDFQIRGKRYHGSTGVEGKRSAEAVERRLRIEAAEGRLGEASQLTLDDAAGKWWAEKGSTRGDADDVERRVDRMLDLMGRNVRLADIDTAMISKAVERRRGQTFTRAPGDDAKTYLPSNATVNRDVVETLRPILSRAERLWGAKGLHPINWKDLKLPEPKETFRYYSSVERAAWLAACGPECRLAVDMLLTYGLRFGELLFRPDQFDAEGRRLMLMKGRKRDVPHVLPLLEHHAREIAARAGRARAADLDVIWFVEEENRQGEVVLRALTYDGLKARITGTADRAKIKGERRIHGARHHAGTDILRKTGNLKMSQRLLGHADIKSTMRYAHALEEDLRAALEDKSVASPAKRNKRRGKA